MAATSLDDTLQALDSVLDAARADGSYLGVFPAMYRSVTGAIHEAVRSGGFFDDDELIEHMTVTFADLYLDAIGTYRSGSRPSECWRETFVIAESGRRRMILQHLLLGMNAHINLDLGVATARSVSHDLPRAWADFIRVNEILFQILDRLQDGLGDVSPQLSLLDRLGGPLDEGFMRMGIRSARDLAWHFAERLVEGPSPNEAIRERDHDVARLGHMITRPWSPIDLAGRIVVLRETRDVGRIIDALSSEEVDLDRAAREAADCIAKPPIADRPLVKRRFRSNAFDASPAGGSR